MSCYFLLSHGINRLINCISQANESHESVNTLHASVNEWHIHFPPAKLAARRPQVALPRRELVNQ